MDEFTNYYWKYYVTINPNIPYYDPYSYSTYLSYSNDELEVILKAYNYELSIATAQESEGTFETYFTYSTNHTYDGDLFYDMTFNTTGMVNDAGKNFYGTLAIWDAYFIIEVVRSLLMIVAITVSKKKIKKVLSWVHFVLTLNDGLGLVALIILMVSRWSVPGRLCSGEYLEYMNSNYT